MSDTHNPSDHLDEPRAFSAYAVPFIVFMILLALIQGAEGFLAWDHPDAPWWRRDVTQWGYPLQTLVCLVLILRVRRLINWGITPRGVGLGALAGVAGIGLWLLPMGIYLYGTTESAGSMGSVVDGQGGAWTFPAWTEYLGLDGREKGFNPGKVFAEYGGLWWGAMILRFVRAVIVVACVEEFFWRGFLMRYVINPDRWPRVAMGAGSRMAFWVSTLGFTLIHAPVDYVAAFLYGSLTYVVYVRTRSLGACVVMHGVANLILGIVAVSYQRYGLW